MDEDKEAIRPECRDMFQKLTNELRLIRTNDLKHLSERIDDLSGWTKWGLSLLLGVCLAILGIVIAG